MKLEDDIRLLKLKKECLLAANSYNDKVLNDYRRKHEVLENKRLEEVNHLGKLEILSKRQDSVCRDTCSTLLVFTSGFTVSDLVINHSLTSNVFTTAIGTITCSLLILFRNSFYFKLKKEMEFGDLLDFDTECYDTKEQLKGNRSGYHSLMIRGNHMKQALFDINNKIAVKRR